MDTPDENELDGEDLAAIEQSEAQIARGEDLDWTEVARELRRIYLSDGPANGANHTNL